MTDPTPDSIAASVEIDPVRSDVAGAVDDAPRASARGGRGFVVALAGVIVAVAFFAAFAVAVGSAPGVAAGTGAAGECGSSSADCGSGIQAASPEQTEACGGDCGGTGASDAPVGRAVLEGGVQVIEVDVSGGYFDPTVIELVSGVPSRIAFGQGSGCLAEVRFPQFGIAADLTAGGATVDIPALETGQYPFSCGMEMVFGVLVVR